MNLLALDTSTEVFSIAVQCGSTTLQEQGPGAANSSTALIPAIQALLARAGMQLASLDAIVFGRGPGSFTGLRTACAVTQGLAFGANLPVLGVETLLAIAEEARARAGATEIVALLDARMEQVYTAPYRFLDGRWTRHGPIMLAAPGDIALPDGWTLAGNAFAAYGDRLPAGPRVAALPAAKALLRLSPALLAGGQAQPASHALPVYIRDKVAQTSAERAAARGVPQIP